MHIVILSHRSYPSGGGEEDLLDKAQWIVERGWRVTWVSHQLNLSVPYTTTSHGKLGDIHSIHMPPFEHKMALHSYLATLNPNLVLAIGRSIGMMQGFRHAPYIAMYHFWTHFVNLGPKSNVGILQNVTKHVQPGFRAILADAARVVFVSPFMQDVASQLGICVPTVVGSPPTARSISTVPYEPLKRKWVLFVNCHHLKASRILPQLIRAHPTIPIRILATEIDNDAEYALSILNAIADRNNDAPVEILSRVADMKEIYNTVRLCVVASVVDETFGRVAVECMASGIPVALSKHGNLSYLAGSDGWFVSCNEPLTSASSIATMYTSPQKLQHLSEYYKIQAAHWSQERIKPIFNALLDDVCKVDTRPTVMFYAPWNEQGLGTQVRSYCAHLEAAGVRTVIFSFLPYDRVYKYTDPLEWVHPRVYYSKNIREEVTDAELLTCLAVYRPVAFVIPETCWNRVFEIAALVRSRGVRVVGIPNVELIRRNEIASHRVFDTLIANNKLCERVLRENGYTGSLVHTGFVLHAANPLGDGGTDATQPLQFVLIGGQNLDGRKQGPKIVEAYVRAYADVKHRPRLIITAQNHASSKITQTAVQRANMDSISFTCTNLTTSDVYELYKYSDVALLLSKYEGLGMGFYEALHCGCPVLTVNAEPHNEIIRHGINGWCLNGVQVPMTENKLSFVTSYDFDLQACIDWFRNTRPDDIRALRKTMVHSDDGAFISTFKHAILGDMSSTITSSPKFDNPYTAPTTAAAPLRFQKPTTVIKMRPMYTPRRK